MNSYDQAALRAIQDYYKKHSKYPERIEATAGHRSKMTCTHFECMEMPGPMDFTSLDSTGLRTPIVTNVPVVALGTCDIVYRSVLVRNHDINLEQAKCKTAEEFQRVGARLARAGLLLLEPKSSWGLQTYNPHLFFSQIVAYVFGEQAAFDVAMAEEETNQLPGD